MNKLHERGRKAALATHGVDRNNATPKRQSRPRRTARAKALALYSS